MCVCVCVSVPVALLSAQHTFSSNFLRKQQQQKQKHPPWLSLLLRSFSRLPLISLLLHQVLFFFPDVPRLLHPHLSASSLFHPSTPAPSCWCPPGLLQTQKDKERCGGSQTRVFLCIFGIYIYFSFFWGGKLCNRTCDYFPVFIVWWVVR